METGYVWADKILAGTVEQDQILNSSRIKLIREKDYLVYDEILDHTGIFYHNALHVFICKTCKAVLSKNMIRTHGRNHGYDVLRNDLEEIDRWCTSNYVHNLAETVNLPLPRGPSVQGILPSVDGFACTTSHDCMYAAVSVNSMGRHARDAHNMHRSPDNYFRPAKVQHLFLSVNSAYFEVEPDLEDLNIPHDQKVCHTLDSIWIPSLEDSRVYSIDNDRDRPPFIRMTSWDEFLPHVREQPTLRKKLLELRVSQSPKYKKLHKAMLLYLRSNRRWLDQYPDHLSLRKTLIHGTNIPRDGWVIGFLILL